ncbi:hypothetical protein AGMMS49975_06250 [Clostridia bacterium]|nr:hypothetical protein AGMMS49975_06250 [Clostridia bacterium]
MLNISTVLASMQDLYVLGGAGSVGDVVEATVILAENTGINSANFTLSYDTSKLSYISGELEIEMGNIDLESDGIVNVGFSSATKLNESIVVARIQFEIISDYGSEAYISIYNVNASNDTEDVTLTTDDGVIFIGSNNETPPTLPVSDIPIPAPSETPTIPIAPIDISTNPVIENLISQVVDVVGDSVVLVVDSPSAISKGKLVMIDPTNSEVKAIVVDNRTLVPARFLSESFGCTVDWNDSTKTITIITSNNQTVTMILGNDSMYVDGNQYTFDVPAQSIGGRTFVPLRTFVENALGKSVYYNLGLIVVSNAPIPPNTPQGFVLTSNTFANQVVIGLKAAFDASFSIDY